MRRTAGGILLTLLLVANGCAPAEVAVSGTVTLDGAPLEEGYIAFRPLPISASAEAANSPIKGGKYQTRVRTGQNRVEITAVQLAAGRTGPDGGPIPPKSLIPEKYNSKSELTEDVQAGGTNEFNFRITSR